MSERLGKVDQLIIGIGITYAYLFGAVCVTNGNTEAIVAPLINMDVTMSQ